MAEDQFSSTVINLMALCSLWMSVYTPKCSRCLSVDQSVLYGCLPIDQRSVVVLPPYSPGAVWPCRLSWRLKLHSFLLPTSHYWSPGGERPKKRKCQMIFLERMREGHHQSDEHWNCFKGNFGETSVRQSGAHLGFSELKDTSLSWTEVTCCHNCIRFMLLMAENNWFKTMLLFSISNWNIIHFCR